MVTTRTVPRVGWKNWSLRKRSRSHLSSPLVSSSLLLDAVDVVMVIDPTFNLSSDKLNRRRRREWGKGEMWGGRVSSNMKCEGLRNAKVTLGFDSVVSV